MKIRLGYVAGPEGFPNYTYCKTLTFAQYQKLGPEKGEERLDKLLRENLDNFFRLLKFNVREGITFYRFSQNIVSLATRSEVKFDYITPYLDKWRAIGEYVKQNELRLDTHPDQFCVLNSTRKEVIEESIHILEFHLSLFRALDLPSHMILHIGSGQGGKEEAMLRFQQTFSCLSPEIQNSLYLENDDKIFDIVDTLTLCKTLKIPMVLDYHHYLCNHGLEKLEDFLLEIFATWQEVGLPPKIHFSSPKSKHEFRSHSDYVDFSKFLKFLELVHEKYDGPLDIMLECKAKEEALFRLCRQLRFFTKTKFITPTTFLF